MPELPEVETVARQLAPTLTGCRIERVDLIDPKLVGLAARRLVGRVIGRVFRHGKHVMLETVPDSRNVRPRARTAPRIPQSAGSLYLAVHLRMTGRLLIATRTAADPPHLRARVTLDRGALLFVDTRRFGTLALYEDLGQLRPAGVDPLDPALTAERLDLLLKRGSGNQPLKLWLLRQDRLAGIGNIYACEICFVARLSPRRAVGSLRRHDVRRLHEAMRDVLAAAIEACGTTFSDFQDARGLSGSYQQFLTVYGRAGEPCCSCQRPIERFVLGQRSTFFCKSCQR